MLVSNGLFDALLFGSLLIGLGLDAAFPSLHGVAFLLACGTVLYMAAQEWSDTLSRRGIWTQEALSTAVALSAGGFFYFRGRNGSDFALLGLSIGLMMASLMLAIATLSALSATAKKVSPAPLAGYFITSVGALVMGALAGLLTIEAPVGPKAICLAVAFALWKAREAFAPPAQNPTPVNVSSSEMEAAPPVDATLSHPLAPHANQRWQIIPRRGTLLDRFVPVLVLGALLIVMARQSGNILQSVAPPASANGSSHSDAAQKP